MVQSAATPDEDPPNAFPVPSIVIIVTIFVFIFVSMVVNYGARLDGFEMSILRGRLASNTATVGLATIISLVIYGYWFIYKFALRGTNDTNAIVYLVITVCLSMGTAILFTNPWIMSFVNLNAMFENTIGISYISNVYKGDVHNLITYEDTKDGDHIHESVRSELATILLSRYDINNIWDIFSMKNGDGKIKVIISDTVSAFVDPQTLQDLVALKYAVGYSCWMFFASLLSIFWAITMFDGITP